MIYFFSNHKDVSFIEELTGQKVERIQHPLIEPDWNEHAVLNNCHEVIQKAVDAEALIINGDYFLVSHIVLQRYMMGRKTGFVAFARKPGDNAVRDKQGNIIHKGVLKPVGIRWISGT